MEKLVFNCWVLRNRELDGIGNFTVQVLQHLIKDYPEQQFDLLVDKKFENIYFNYPNVTLHCIFPALRHPALYVFYLEVVLPFYLKKLKPSLVIGMDGFLSLSSAAKQVAVVYDLNFEHSPENLPLRNRLYYKYFFPKFVKKAVHIITISEYSKNDIVETYFTQPGKIDNVLCGISNYFFPVSVAEQSAVKAKYANGKNYFFFAGTMHPRKNIAGLIKAFTSFKEQNNNDFKLVLAGKIMWDDNSIKNLIENNDYKNDIVLTGRLSNEELRLVLASAWCLVFVPTFEGFGLPIIEAWQCGVPVICSNVTSMPEIAGEAAITVNPLNTNDIVKAMQAMMNMETRNAYIKAGQLRKNIFSWENTASLFSDSIKKSIKNF